MHNHYMPPAQDDQTPILDILVTLKKITPEVKDQARAAFINTGANMMAFLKERNLVTEDDIVAALAKYYNVPFVHLVEQPASPVALGYVDKSVAERFHAFPYDYQPEAGELHLAMSNPVDLAAIEFLEKKTGLRVKPAVATAEDIQNAIDLRYEQSLSSEVTAALKEANVDTHLEVKTIDLSSMSRMIKEAPIAKIIAKVLEFAIKSRASDVHIEPEDAKTRIRYRIDGILHEKLVVPRDIHDALVSRIKILSDMKIDEKRIPQDGRFNFRTEDEEVDLRVSSLPTVNGEKIVMRLLKKTGGVPTLPELGLRGRALKNLEDAILKPHGIILVTGPTGSGKTTTLYSVLSRINTVKVNVVTIEDPVEYQISGVNQVQVNPVAGLTFASGLRSFLRQDPNVIMVGEVRDEETAELAVQAALTGHLVFSTLHTNSASGALPRLLDMKAEPFLLASTITAIVGQRVARQICPTCKKSYIPEPTAIAEMQKVLGKLWPVDKKTDLQLVKGEGCAQCANSGYLGRIGIFEVLPITEKIGRLILEHAPASEVENEAVAEGMVTMKQDGYLKVLEGITTLDEILRVAEE